MSEVDPALHAGQRDDAVLCIGLDIAWFGGQQRDRDSQYDCIASVLTGPKVDSPLITLTRLSLVDRDPAAELTKAAIERLLHQNKNITRVVFALDAPIQAIERSHLPERSALPATGTIVRRACENRLSAMRQMIDDAAGGSAGWHPNIQPGAPLAPRVTALVRRLQTDLGFALWTRESENAERLVIECFPAEAIWATKRMGHYPEAITSMHAKAYKAQRRNGLTGDQVSRLVHDVLDAFASTSGDMAFWPTMVNGAIEWMLKDLAWQTDGSYRGGKLLDDVVDSMICLATSLSYVHRCAHAWHDHEQAGDGHIIGPGCLDADMWIPACSGHRQGAEA